MNLHIFTAENQPTDKFTTPSGYVMKFKPKELVTCYGCGKRRRAENCTVQAFYDGLRFWCRTGKGCKRKDAK